MADVIQWNLYGAVTLGDFGSDRLIQVDRLIRVSYNVITRLKIRFITCMNC